MGHLRGQMGPDLRRQTCCGRCWAPCSRVGGSLGPPQGWWLWRSGDKCTRGGSRVRRVPVTGMSGGRAEAQEVWEAAGVVSLGSTSQPASARWFLHPWVCSQQYLQKYCGLGVITGRSVPPTNLTFWTPALRPRSVRWAQGLVEGDWGPVQSQSGDSELSCDLRVAETHRLILQWRTPRGCGSVWDSTPENQHGAKRTRDPDNT